MTQATFSLIEKTETTLVVRQSETDQMCGNRLTLTSDGKIKTHTGRTLSVNARIPRSAVYAIARKEGFAFTPQAGAYWD